MVRVNPQPCSKARRTMAEAVVGGALARPKGFGNLIPQMLTLRSTRSMAAGIDESEIMIFGIVD